MTTKPKRRLTPATYLATDPSKLTNADEVSDGPDADADAETDDSPNSEPKSDSSEGPDASDNATPDAGSRRDRIKRTNVMLWSNSTKDNFLSQVLDESLTSNLDEQQPAAAPDKDLASRLQARREDRKQMRLAKSLDSSSLDVDSTSSNHRRHRAKDTRTSMAGSLDATARLIKARQLSSQHTKAATEEFLKKTALEAKRKEMEKRKSRFGKSNYVSESIVMR